MGHRDGTPVDLDDRLFQIREEYLDRRLSGEALDRQAVLAAHPDLAGPLDRELALVEVILEAAAAWGFTRA